MFRGLRGFVSGVALAGFTLAGTAVASAQEAAKPVLTLEGDATVMIVLIKPDKTADFEAVLAALKDALQKSDTPEAKQQAAGWRIVKGLKPQPDGTIVYTHIISPVVKGADYSVLQNIYTVVKDPTEQRALYDKYAGAFAATLLQVPFTMVTDFGK